MWPASERVTSNIAVSRLGVKGYLLGITLSRSDHLMSVCTSSYACLHAVLPLLRTASDQLHLCLDHMTRTRVHVAFWSGGGCTNIYLMIKSERR